MSSTFLSYVNIPSMIAELRDAQAESSQPYKADGQKFKEDERRKEVAQVQKLIEKPPVKLSADDIKTFWDAVKNLNTIGIDDRLLLLEKLLTLMARLSDATELEDLKIIGDKVQEFVIQTLYDDLPHPPSTYLATFENTETIATAPKGIKYAYRSADGSNYNPLFPSLGKAGTPYARTVPGLHPIPKQVLPDAGLVFDTLLKRDEFVPHPGGVSSLFFAFADLIIHCIFDTNHTDWTINDTSSYLDLSVLYGNNQAQQDEVRRKDGSGKLWDDVFADARLRLMPPATCALLVLLSRNHNYIAQKLLDIDENNNLVPHPYPTDPDTCKKQDDEIFHRARMVNCGYFIKIILGDYVGSILGLVRDESSWRLDPLMSSRERNHEVSARGEGNVVSIEFNLLYRWHSTLSKQDTEWTTNLFNRIFQGKDLSQVTIEDFKNAAHQALIADTDVKKREFGGLKRQDNGRFKDSDIAKLIQDATSWRASAFKARGIPEAMRIIEILGIEQARSWGACSLNEFRKFLGLKPYTSFKDWNPDEKIHKAAAALYKDIDNLELHVGLQAEEPKEPGDGAGLCPGYTISRAILSDAVALTRGDRYLTVDFTPANLTAWGYADCQYDDKDGSFGGMLTKLLFRHLPEYFPAGSAYAHFPFLDPVFMKEHLAKENSPLLDQYTWDRPQAPVAFVPAKTYAKVNEVFKNPSVFLSGYDDRLATVTGFGKSAKSIEKLVAGRRNIQEMLSPRVSQTAWPKYFREEVQSLVEDKSTERVGSEKVKFVDIVGDVINLLPGHWIAEQVMGLPLKTSTNEAGEWREERYYDRFADVGRYIFLNFDPINDWRLRNSAQETFGEKLHKETKKNLDGLGSVFKALGDALEDDHVEGDAYETFLKQAKSRNPEATASELATYIFAAVVPTAAQFSQAIAHVVDFYLKEDRKAEREDIVKQSETLYDPASIAKVMGYVQEALRLNPVVRGVYRTAAKATKLGDQEVPAGARVFASVIDANHDESEFGPNASDPTFNRTDGKYGVQGLGEEGLFTAGFFESVVPAILCEILSLKNIKRAPGVSGKFSGFEEDWHGSKRQVYIDLEGKYTPFPDSLLVQYDA